MKRTLRYTSATCNWGRQQKQLAGRGFALRAAPPIAQLGEHKLLVLPAATSTHLAEDAAANEDVGGVVHRRNPQAQHVGTIGRVLLRVLFEWRKVDWVIVEDKPLFKNGTVGASTIRDGNRSASAHQTTSKTASRTLPPVMTVRGSITLPRLLLIFMPAVAVEPRPQIGGRAQGSRLRHSGLTSAVSLAHMALSPQCKRVLSKHDCLPAHMASQRHVHSCCPSLRCLTLVVQHEAVGQHLLVGRVAVGCHRGEQRRLEPAAVLVRALWEGGQQRAAR